MDARKNKKKKSTNKSININKIEKIQKKNFNLMLLVTFFLGVLLIFSAYAWFNASLDVKVKFINLTVSKKSGLYISLDGIDFSSSVQISKKVLLDELSNRYPKHTSQWANGGLYPVSSKGIPNSNTDIFEIYFASNFEVDYETNKSYLTTKKSIETVASDKKNYIAFDIFLKNITGSPVSDNLYIDEGTNIIVDSEETPQILGLINSSRFGFVKVGSVSRNSTVTEIQNIECNNNCEMVIYEPNSTRHTDLSIQRAKKYNVNLVNGEYYPTLAITGEMNFFEINDTIKGKVSENFELQNTQVDINKPIFEIPDGVTKLRVYVWIEGQDIDSLATRSEGADVSVVINLIKDTAGYDAFNE